MPGAASRAAFAAAAIEDRDAWEPAGFTVLGRLAGRIKVWMQCNGAEARAGSIALLEDHVLGELRA
jgi:hypothetical protein